MTASNLTRSRLPDLPSGRPRRMLVFTEGLQPDDLTLRAFDLVRHLHAYGHWYARVVSGAEGPMRAEFEAASVVVQVVDNPHDAALVERQVWWAQQDAVIAFGPARTWAEPLAKQHQLTFITEAAGDRQGFDLYAAADRRNELRLRLALGEGERLALAFATEAKDEGSLNGLLRAVHNALTEARLADWHLGWVGAQGTVTLHAPSGATTTLSPSTDRVARSAWVSAADAVLDLHRHGTGFRPLLDAAALAVPVIADPTPELAALLPAPLVAPAELASPTDAADALIDLVLNPAASARRVASAHVYAMTHRNPARQLPAWVHAIESAVKAASTASTLH